MRRYLFIVFVFLSVLAISHAQTVITGFGAATCGQFAADYKKYPERVEGLYFSWAQGYLSGRSFEAHAVMLAGMNRIAPDLSAMSLQEQKQHIREYCDVHPLGTYSDAVNDLIWALVGAESSGKQKRK